MKLTVDQTTIDRIKSLREQQDKSDLMLRIMVDGGGCSGFQYHMSLTTDQKPDDHVFDECVVTDDLSLTFLKDSTVSFKDDLIGSDFVIDNPNAVAGCGCGTSFAI